MRERQDGYLNAWIFGAACPSTGQTEFLVATETGLEFMQIFIDQLSKKLEKNAHAILVLDNASWHTSPKLSIPKNIYLHFLPPYSPELNPIENLWKYIKENFLCNKFFKGIDEILSAGANACKKITKEMIKSVCARNYEQSC